MGEDDVMEWMGVNISCTASNGSSITVNLVARESKQAVWGRMAGCLSKEPVVFDRAEPMRRRITDRIDETIDQKSVVTDEEKEMLLKPWVL